MGQPKSTRTTRPQTLSESRRVNYGISATNIITRKVCSSRQAVDYVSMNDGYDKDDRLSRKKKRRKESYHPKSAPSASRISANKKLASSTTPAIEGVDTRNKPTDLPTAGILSGVPTALLPAEPAMSAASASASIITELNLELPDLVINRTETSDASKTAKQTLADTNINTAEDLEAARTLLSLGATTDDTLEDDDDDNTRLMPIGGVNNPEDLAPQEIHLDQINMDKAIAEIIETEKLEKEADDHISNEPNTAPTTVSLPTEQVQIPANIPPTRINQQLQQQVTADHSSNA